MAKRLTEKQKKEIIQSFQHGKTVEFLSEKFNCNKLTIVRNLKKILGEAKYKNYIAKHKSLNLIADDMKINLKKEPEFDLETFNTKEDLLDNTIDKQIESEFSPASSFFEIAPLDCDIDNSNQKDLSSVPISEMNFPKTVYMIVDKKIELETKYLKDYPEWQFLSEDELSRKTIEIHNDLKIAKSKCNKEQKVIKVPNTNVFRLVAPFLISKGISRIVASNDLIAL